MKTTMIEATNGPRNWGKFLVGIFESSDWTHTSAVDPGRSLLAARGHGADEVMVMDLETCEGAIFRHGGLASADLNKHKVWVCPLFEPFLQWLYTQDISDLGKLPKVIDLPGAPFAMRGYRREGKA